MSTIDDIHAVERLMQTLDEYLHLMEAMRARFLSRQLLELPEQQAQLTERVNRAAELLAQLTARVDEFAERTDRRFNQIADDMTWLKNVSTVCNCSEPRRGNSRGGRLRYRRQLSRAELIRLTRNQDLTVISAGDLTGFQRADLVMDASNDRGQR